MVKSNFEFIGNMGKTDIEITGSTNEIILELALILMKIKVADDNVYLDILNAMEIINNSINEGIEVDELEKMFVCQYRKTLSKVGD